jgi:hypothetical protein
MNKADIDHLIGCLKKTHELTKDWDGDWYCIIKLKWDNMAQTLDILMPGCITKNYKHAMPPRPQHSPCTPYLQHYGCKAQRLLPLNISPPLS